MTWNSFQSCCDVSTSPESQSSRPSSHTRRTPCARSFFASVSKHVSFTFDVPHGCEKVSRDLSVAAHDDALERRVTAAAAQRRVDRRRIENGPGLRIDERFDIRAAVPKNAMKATPNEVDVVAL